MGLPFRHFPSPSTPVSSPLLRRRASAQFRSFAPEAALLFTPCRRTAKSAHFSGDCRLNRAGFAGGHSIPHTAWLVQTALKNFVISQIP